MIVEMNTLEPSARAWVFASPEPWSGSQRETLLSLFERFLDQWESHGAPVAAGCELIHDRFLVVAADDSAHPSGCSVDQLFRLVQQVSRQTGVDLLDPQRVHFREKDGTIRGVSRSEFRALADSGEIGSDTIVFDTSVERLGDLREGRFERRAAEGWHRELVG